MTDGNSRMGPGADLPKAIEDQLKRNERQFGVVYDLVAAGEINGLVGGLSGVYLNNTPIIDYNRYNQLRLRRATGAAVNGNTKQITAAGLFNGVSLDDGDRYLEFRGTGGAGSPGGVVTALASALAAGDTKVTINSSSFIADTHDKNPYNWSRIRWCSVYWNNDRYYKCYRSYCFSTNTYCSEFRGCSIHR